MSTELEVFLPVSDLHYVGQGFHAIVAAWESSGRTKSMWPSWMKVALGTKSLVELTVACQFAAAGRIITGVCVALMGVAPHVWAFSRDFVEGPRE
jgi:hypothetical protein